MRCPICGKRVALSDPVAPFCSERCRLLDLGNWASGSYRISTPLPAEESRSASAGNALPAAGDGLHREAGE